jgi:glutathione S-transferase
MKIYNSFGPNPRALCMVLLEKGLELPMIDVDPLAMENRRAPYTDRNPGGSFRPSRWTTARVIGETVAIFEYLEEKHPGSTTDRLDRRGARRDPRWQRRIELKITEHLYNGLRFAEGLEPSGRACASCLRPQTGRKATVRDNLRLDPLLAGPWIAGARFTVADVILYCALDFGRGVGQPADPALERVTAWFERVAARPSAAASLHPLAATIGSAG